MGRSTTGEADHTMIGAGESALIVHNCKVATMCGGQTLPTQASCSSREQDVRVVSRAVQAVWSETIQTQ